MRRLVFVYGTLMRGERNHGYLARACFCGAWRTPPAYDLFSLVSYPVACPQGKRRLSGEVYRVDQRTMSQLDALEEYPHVYTRQMIQTHWGPAWIYLQQSPPSAGVRLPGGDWRRRRTRAIDRDGFEPVLACQPFAVGGTGV